MKIIQCDFSVLLKGELTL